MEVCDQVPTLNQKNENFAFVEQETNFWSKQFSWSEFFFPTRREWNGNLMFGRKTFVSKSSFLWFRFERSKVSNAEVRLIIRLVIWLRRREWKNRNFFSVQAHNGSEAKRACAVKVRIFFMPQLVSRQITALGPSFVHYSTSWDICSLFCTIIFIFGILSNKFTVATYSF